MKDSLKLKASEVVVRFGKVLKVIKVDKEMVYLKPFFDKGGNRGGLSYSLPVNKLVMAKLRRVASKKELDKLWKNVFQRSEEQVEKININKAMESNKLKEIMKVVALLGREKTSLGMLPGGKLRIYKEALEQLVAEVAVVEELSLEKAKVKVEDILKNRST